MDPPDHSQNRNTPLGFGGSGEELTYVSGHQFPPGMVVAPDGTIQPPTAQPVGARQPQEQHTHQFLQSLHAEQLHRRRGQERESLRQQLQAYWENQRQEIERVNDFKSPSVPWARIKKIMKADEDVRMVSAEAPVLFAKACEMFISELTLCAWNHTVGDKRTTIQKTDVAAALAGKETFDFLHHIVPKEVQQLKDEAAASGVMIGNLAKDPGGTSMPVPRPSGSVPYGYMPPQHAPQVGIAGVIMGDPAMDPNLHAQQQPLPYNMETHDGTAGVMMGDPAVDPNLYAQQPYHYIAPQGGTAGVITGDPAMDPNLYAQQPDLYVAHSQMLQQQPPEQQEIQQMWPQQQLEQQQAPQMWPQQPPEQQPPPPDN